jgi:hypothetical protein
LWRHDSINAMHSAPDMLFRRSALTKSSAVDFCLWDAASFLNTGEAKLAGLRQK